LSGHWQYKNAVLQAKMTRQVPVPLSGFDLPGWLISTDLYKNKQLSIIEIRVFLPYCKREGLLIIFYGWKIALDKMVELTAIKSKKSGGISGMSLKVKMIVFFLLVGLVPLAGIGVLSYNMASQNIEDEVYKSLDMFSDLTKSQFSDFFQERIGDGRVLATTRDVYQSMNILNEIGGDRTAPEWQARVAILDTLIPAVAREYGFTQIMIADTTGTIVYDSRKESEGLDLSGRAYMQGSLGGRATWSELFYSDVINEIVMIISTPIYSQGETGAIIGAFNILLNGDVIDHLVHDGVEELGQSGDSYLVDANGLLLTNTRLGDLSSGATLNQSINTRAIELVSGPIREGNNEFQTNEVYLDYMVTRFLEQ
jgi:methyl-accepting chemotaxis protein